MPLLSKAGGAALPCPWCAEGSDGLSAISSGFGSYYVRCEDCGMRGPSGTNEGAAFSNWNHLPRGA